MRGKLLTAVTALRQQAHGPLIGQSTPLRQPLAVASADKVCHPETAPCLLFTALQLPAAPCPTPLIFCRQCIARAVRPSMTLIIP